MIFVCPIYKTIKFVGFYFFLTSACAMSSQAHLILTPEEKDYLAANPIITFASQDNYAPFEFLTQDGKSAGIVVELVRWIGNEAGFEPKFIHSSFKGAREAVRLGQADAITSLFYSDTRALEYAFTDKMMEVPASIFVLESNRQIQGIKDLMGKKLAMQRGDYAEEFLKKNGIICEIIYTRDFPSALKLVLKSKAEAIIGDEQVIFYEINRANLKSKFRVTDYPLYLGKNCMAVKRENLVLISILNKGLAQAKSSGFLNQATAKWNGRQTESRYGFWYTYRHEAGLILTSLVISFATIFFWNMQLRKTVDQRTREIKKRELAYRALTENSMDLVVRLDLQLKIQYVNFAAARFVDRRIRDILGASLSEAGFSQEVVQKWEEGIQEVFLTGRSVSVILANEAVKSQHWLDCRLVPEFGGYNQIESVLSTCRDITESKLAEIEKRQLELQMQQAQKLESLGVMAGGIAHDFNNLLATIQGNAELALMENCSSEKHRAYLGIIVQTTQSAAGLCSQMLAYTGKAKFVTDSIDLNQLTKTTLPLLELSLAKRANLELSLETSLPLIEGDKTQLQQILMNLVINAAESIQTSYGTINIKTDSRLYLEDQLRELSPTVELKAGRYVQLTVSDNGIGMSSEILAKIFDPFFTTKFTGRGLGLAAVLGIVKSHNGFLKVSSIEEIGSEFTIGFPAIISQTTAFDAKIGTASSAWKSSGLILVADDEKTVLSVTKKLCEKMGLTVITATNGSEAIESFRSRPEEFRAVMLDYNMPVVDGVKAMLEIRKIKPDTIVILSSGYHEVEASTLLNNLDKPSAFLEKPYSFTKLSETFQKHLS